MEFLELVRNDFEWTSALLGFIFGGAFFGFYLWFRGSD